MSDLYAKIAGGYDKPTSNELDNLSIIENRFEKAKKDFEKAKKDFDKLRKKAKVKDLALKTFEEFLDD